MSVGLSAVVRVQTLILAGLHAGTAGSIVTLDAKVDGAPADPFVSDLLPTVGTRDTAVVAVQWANAA